MDWTPEEIASHDEWYANRKNEIVTLGYSHPGATKTLESLTAQGYHIIDIRDKPVSTIPGYSKATLSAKYSDRYHWIGELGNIHHATKGNQVGYREWERGIARLKRAHDKAPLVVICQCRFAEKCHRWGVSLYLGEQGLTVTHLLQEEHSGMAKHANLWIPGRCTWVISGILCDGPASAHCSRCNGPLCELHARTLDQDICIDCKVELTRKRS